MESTEVEQMGLWLLHFRLMRNQHSQIAKCGQKEKAPHGQIVTCVFFIITMMMLVSFFFFFFFCKFNLYGLRKLSQ